MTIAYFDLTSAAAYALHAAAARTGTAIEWRGVEGDPSRPVPMVPFDARSRARFEAAIPDAVRADATLGIALPRGAPNTRRALVALAAVARVHPGRAAALRGAFFEAYWREGADLSDIHVVGELAAQAAVPAWLDLASDEASATLAAWEVEWRTANLGGVPRVIRDDGRILWDVRAVDDAVRFLSGD